MTFRSRLRPIQDATETHNHADPTGRKHDIAVVVGETTIPFRREGRHGAQKDADRLDLQAESDLDGRC